MLYLFESAASILIPWNSSAQEICLFFPLFIQLFIYISKYSWLLFYTLVYSSVSTLLLSCISLIYQHQYKLSFFIFILLFQHFLTFGHYTMLQARLLYSLSQSLDISLGALAPSFGEWYQKQRSGCQVYSLLLRCHCFQALSSERGKICVYKLTHVYAHFYT